MLPTKDSRSKDTQIDSKGMENNTPHKWKQNKAWVEIFLSDKIDFKSKTIARDKEGYYIRIKRIQHIHIYEPNIKAPKYIKQILTDIKADVDSTVM